MYELYFSPGSCSLAPHIVLEEIGVPFEKKFVPIWKQAHREPEFLAVNPRSRVPALKIGDHVLTENIAILLYLGQTHPEAGLLPAKDDAEAFARCVEWLTWLATTIHISIAQTFRSERYVEKEADYPTLRAQALVNLRRDFADLEQKLAATHYALPSGYSVVDAFLVVCYYWGTIVKLPMTEYPAWTKLIAELKERPAVQRALATERLTIPT